MKKKFLSTLLSLFLVVLASSFIPLVLFLGNIGSIKFYEIAIFMGLFSFVGLAFFGMSLIFLKSKYKAAIVASILSLIFQNAGRLTSLISYKFVVVIFIILIVAVLIAAKKLLKNEIAKTFVSVMSCILAGLCAFNTITSMGQIISVATSGTETEKEINSHYEELSNYISNTNSAELSNVYFILLDEYAGFDTLKKYYDFDNNDFKNYLESNNFTVASHSTNYMTSTYECAANLFNLEVSQNNRYENTSESYCREKALNGVLFRILEDAGYTINTAQSFLLADYKSETQTVGDKWSRTANDESTIDLLLEPSMLSPFIGHIRSILNGIPLGVDESATTIAPLKYFADSANVGKPNTFNLCYACSPHVPFYFDKDGNRLESANNNWSDKNYYLDQLQYCSSLIQKTVDNIIANDPDSIIIIMSDHGLRDHSSEVADSQWMSSISIKESADTLCAVYYKGEAFADIDGMCGSNVLISIINKALGYQIPLIPESEEMYYITP